MSRRAFMADGALLVGAVLAMSALAAPVLKSSATFVDVESSQGAVVATAKLDVAAAGGLNAGVRGTGIANAAYSKMEITNTGTAPVRFSFTSKVPGSQARLSDVYRLDITTIAKTCDSAGFGGTFQSSGAIASADGLPVLGNPRNGFDPGDQHIGPGASRTVCMRVWLPRGVGSTVTGETIAPLITVHAEQV